MSENKYPAVAKLIHQYRAHGRALRCIEEAAFAELGWFTQVPVLVEEAIAKHRCGEVVFRDGRKVPRHQKKWDSKASYSVARAALPERPRNGTD